MLAKLEKAKQEGLLRKLTVNKDKVDFCSNDYLGLAKDQTEQQLGFKQSGATGSRLISGNSIEAENAEQYIAKYHGFEASLLFNSGYMANVGLCASIAGKNDTFILDELVHASIMDGARLSLASKFNFKHNDLNSLDNKLKTAKGQVFVFVESLYSMNGDVAPIVQIAELCEQYKAHLIVDEAHAVGVWGPDGKGFVYKYDLQNKVFACVYAYGKAFGLHGAAVVGSELLKSYLINFSRTFIYSTALPPVTYYQLHQTYLKLPEINKQHLFDLINYFKNQSQSLKGYSFIESESQIQGIVVGENTKALMLSEYLNQEGFFVIAIRSPSVPKGTERIRICLHIFNSFEQIDLLFEKLKKFTP